MSLYSDVLIENGDLVLDGASNPNLITDRACIAQDVVHAIYENGLARKLVALRGESEIRGVLQEISLLIESDRRIEPGTAQAIKRAEGDWMFTARTQDFEVEIWL